MLRKLNTPQLILLSWLTFLVLGLCLRYLLTAASLPGRENIDQMDDLALFAAAVLVAPIAETAICQLLPFWILRRSKRWQLKIAISTLLFTLAHISTVVGIAVGLLGGVLYASLFFILEERSFKVAFIGVAITHALYNGTLVTLDRIFHF